jgi:hypothetical protein
VADARYVDTDYYSQTLRHSGYTPEQVAAIIAEQQAAWQADARAQALLVSLLTAEQRASYERDGTFTVDAMGRSFRLGAPVVYEEVEHSREVLSYCIGPTSYVPHADTLLSQKLLLEADLPRFMRIACVG